MDPFRRSNELYALTCLFHDSQVHDGLVRYGTQQVEHCRRLILRMRQRNRQELQAPGEV